MEAAGVSARDEGNRGGARLEGVHASLQLPHVLRK